MYASLVNQHGRTLFLQEPLYESFREKKKGPLYEELTTLNYFRNESDKNISVIKSMLDREKKILYTVCHIYLLLQSKENKRGIALIF